MPLLRIKAATAASYSSSHIINVPIEVVGVGSAEHDSELAQQAKIFNDIYT
jgi:hypothetical protein